MLPIYVQSSTTQITQLHTTHSTIQHPTAPQFNSLVYYSRQAHHLLEQLDVWLHHGLHAVGAKMNQNN